MLLLNSSFDHARRGLIKRTSLSFYDVMLAYNFFGRRYIAQLATKALVYRLSHNHRKLKLGTTNLFRTVKQALTSLTCNTVGEVNIFAVVTGTMTFHAV